MADAPPPAKRARHHYDLTKTFDVLVGKEPNQQRFTVHHDLLVQRSEFFKAARSSRWTQSDQPTTLDDHDPDTFSTYLHCLYFGVDAIKDRLNVIAEEYGATNEPTVSTNESDSGSSSDESSDSGDSADNDVLDYNTDFYEKEDDVDDAKTRVLIKLYILADKLIDPNTTNLVIDTLISHVDTLLLLPGSFFINIVYKCTPTGSPLRALFRDWYIHELNYFEYQAQFDAKTHFPVEFLKDVLVETGQICSGNENRIIAHVLRFKAIDRPTGHYHQKVESSQNNGGK